MFEYFVKNQDFAKNLINSYLYTKKIDADQESKFFTNLNHFYEFFSPRESEIEVCFDYIKQQSDLYVDTTLPQHQTENFVQLMKCLKVDKNFNIVSVLTLSSS